MRSESYRLECYLFLTVGPPRKSVTLEKSNLMGQTVSTVRDRVQHAITTLVVGLQATGAGGRREH